MSEGRKFNDSIYILLEEAVKKNPNNPSALTLKGLADGLFGFFLTASSNKIYMESLNFLPSLINNNNNNNKKRYSPLLQNERLQYSNNLCADSNNMYWNKTC
jgi:hypothetical protein